MQPRLTQMLKSSGIVEMAAHYCAIQIFAVNAGTSLQRILSQ